jgi:hypothetical protein
VRQRALRLPVHGQAELRLAKLNGPQLAGYPLDDGPGKPDFIRLKSLPHVVLQRNLGHGYGRRLARAVVEGLLRAISKSYNESYGESAWAAGLSIYRPLCGHGVNGADLARMC